jgi:2-hydroxycyclohexanecarboxyl-CoA dehydrogenase
VIDLTGKTAVVTGAGSGIGKAIAFQLATQGAAVATIDRNGEAADATTDEIKARGGTSAAFHVDVTDLDAVAALPEAVAKSLGLATILVNNAGWDLGMPFVDTTPDFWREVIDINYLGVVATSHAFMTRIIADEAPAGRFVNIASDAGRVGSLGETVYAGAKGGVIAFTKSLAREAARYGISVNCVCPGPTETPLFYAQPEKLRNSIVRVIPKRRLGKPEDLAAAVAFFCSDEAEFVTGQVLSVSGGLTMAG